MSVRLTLASNANHQTRTIAIVPVSQPTPHFHLLSVAKTKLRLKKPTIIYLPTGAVLLPTDPIDSLENDTLLLISSGEPYTGSPVPAATLAPIHTLTPEENLDLGALKQLKTCARLPGMQRVIGMPDLHPGGKFPVGAVCVSKNIHPALIGGDIGCGMSWYRTTLRASSLESKNDLNRAANALVGLETPWRTAEERAQWCEPADGEWESALGSIGGGNHFTELQTLEVCPAPHERRSVVLLVHSGSRGWGKSILEQFCGPAEEYTRRFPGADRNTIEPDSAKAVDYLAVHNRALAWASHNRDLIAHRILSLLEPSHPDFAGDDIPALHAAIAARKFADFAHNAVAVAPDDPTLWVHRKGAAEVRGDTELLPLPSSHGTPTLLIRPTSLAEAGWSAPHGTGRLMSSNAAWAKFNERLKHQPVHDMEAEYAAVMGQEGVKGEQSVPPVLVLDDERKQVEDHPDAFKDVKDVAEDLVRSGVGAVVGWARPRVTYKMRKRY